MSVWLAYSLPAVCRKSCADVQQESYISHLEANLSCHAQRVAVREQWCSSKFADERADSRRNAAVVMPKYQ